MIALVDESSPGQSLAGGPVQSLAVSDGLEASFVDLAQLWVALEVARDGVDLGTDLLELVERHASVRHFAPLVALLDIFPHLALPVLVVDLAVLRALKRDLKLVHDGRHDASCQSPLAWRCPPR